MKGLVAEFKDFLVKQNAASLAIGVITGAALGKVVSGAVDDLVMPLVGLVLPGGEWRTAQTVLNTSHAPDGTLVVNAIKYGDFMGRTVDFVIIGLIVFLIVRYLIRNTAPPPPATKGCPYCLETIPLAATRCRACCQAV